jgi:hypothetical protein
MVMFEFSMDTLRLPSGREMLNLKSLKYHVLFSNVADEQEPLKAKLMIPLSSGMLNLSEGVKNWRVCACVKELKHENTNATIITTISPDRTGPQCDAVKGATVVNVW